MSVYAQPSWNLSWQGFDKEKEKTRSTLLTVGNGHIGVRGSFPELDTEEELGIFVAGYYDELPRPALNPDSFTPFLISWSHLELVKGYQKEVCLVKCPDFLDGLWQVEEEVVSLQNARLLGLERNLCLQTGELTAGMRFVTPKGREVLLTARRLAARHRTDCVFCEYTLTPVNFSGAVTYRACINPDRRNFNISGIYQTTSDGTDHAWYRLFDVLKSEQAGCDGLSMLVHGRGLGVRAGFATRVQAPQAQAVRHVQKDWEHGVLELTFNARQGQPITLSRLSAFALGGENPDKAAQAAVGHWEEYADALAQNERLWGTIWKDSDLVIQGDEQAQLGIRVSLYHLLLSACFESEQLSVTAKGLSGEGYRGMVFWDTDMHMLPFFVYTQPCMARNIAAFRYHTLAGARDKARRLGGVGACYPWETGISGYEECERFLKLLTHQLHITGDVVYALWHYCSATGDTAFYENCACEVFIETARFWLNRGYEKDGYFQIPQASGPDELHLECDNNAYVNNLAALNFALAARAIAFLRDKKPALWDTLRVKTGITPEEIDGIFTYQNKVKTQKGSDGLFEQCDGFFALRDVVVLEDNPDTVPADTQTVKQADVMMLLYLLPDLVSREELLRNWAYYEPRTTHTSSLSYGVHGIIAARLGLQDEANAYLQKSLGIDLFNENARAEDGTHMAAYGMTWSAIVFGVAGVRIENGTLFIQPAFFPPDWTQVSFTLQCFGARVHISVSPERICVENEAESARPIAVVIRGQEFLVEAGARLCV